MENTDKKISTPKTFSGKVVSTKMKDTAVVLVERYIKHIKYGKFLKSQKKLKAQDEGNKCQLNDIVEIVETRPISKDKRFRVVNK